MRVVPARDPQPVMQFAPFEFQGIPVRLLALLRIDNAPLGKLSNSICATGRESFVRQGRSLPQGSLEASLDDAIRQDDMSVEAAQEQHVAGRLRFG